MIWDRFTAANGLIYGAKDLVVLAYNPALFMCMSDIGIIFALCGVAGSLINTRAMITFVLMSLLFLRPRKMSRLDLAIFVVVALAFLTINVAYLYSGFMIKGGIR